MNGYQEILFSLNEEGRYFDARDPLVDIVRNENKLFRFTGDGHSFPLNEIPKKLIVDAQAAIKENGVNPLCVSQYLMPTAENQSTPVFLIPVSFKVDRINNELQIEYSDEVMVNPFVQIYLERKEVDLPSGVKELFNVNELSSDQMELFVAFLRKTGIAISAENRILGNFHPYRFSHLKDLDLIVKNGASLGLKQLLVGEKESTDQIALTAKNLFDADNDQTRISAASEEDNIALIGPPGTGKSQFLTNLIGKYLYNGKRVLAVSEKRTALDVIKKRLGERGLDPFCFVYTSKKDSADFVRQLKENWQRFEHKKVVVQPHLERSSMQLNNLQFILDVLQKDNVIGGTSLEDFFNRFPQFEQQGDVLVNPPDFKEIDKHHKSIEGLLKISNRSFIRLIGKKAFNEFAAHAYLEKINALKVTIERLQQFGAFDSLPELDQLIANMGYAQIAENELFRSYQSILKPDSSAQKSFLKTAKKLDHLDEKLKRIEKATHWKRALHTAELYAVKDRLSKNASGLTWSRKRYWRSISIAPFESGISLIESELLHRKLQADYNDALVSLKQMGVEVQDIPMILHWIKQYTKPEWEHIHVLSNKLRSYSKNVHLEVNDLSTKIAHLLDKEGITSLTQDLQSIIENSEELINWWSELGNISPELLNAIQKASSTDELNSIVCRSQWSIFSQRYPGMQHFHPSSLRDKIHDIIHEQEVEYKLFAGEIEQTLRSNFEKLEEILQTPARKLSAEDKILKHKLRLGKSILAKEFSKKTRHRSLFQLYESEARIWIQTLIPVMMCNTELVSSCFPFEEDLFDLSVFDEASQTPLFSAVGAVQRGSKMVIAGDDRQMRPVKAFSTRSEEIRDLLTQGLLYLRSDMLKHHYRSYSEQLIAFSNKHFYGDQLIAFPSYPLVKEPIKKIKVNGQYTERRNPEEAQQVAERIQKLIGGKDTFGVVAFSEDQVDQIWKSLDENKRTQLQELIDENQAFIKPVEKVQGDECDILLISFTFAKNETGVLKYTFGPMSTSHGMNRLNVLLTRARKSIEFYTSLDHADFRISSNPSIELIRKWFALIEDPSEQKKVVFPFHLDPEINKNVLTIRAISSCVQDAHELCTLHKVLENRGWELKYA